MEEDTPPFVPRKWQREAHDRYVNLDKARFLLEACPGAGKTKWALWIARELIDRGEIQRVVVIVPLRTVRTQWAKVAREFGLRLDDRYRAAHGGAEPKGYDGLVVTYGALLGTKAAVHAVHCADWPTLVIVDEIHHCAEHLGWGMALMDAFGRAARILSLSGTPFRKQGVIPYVEYEPDPDAPGEEVCKPDTRWTYAQELAERPSGVRRVEPTLWDGSIEWKTPDGAAYGPMLLSERLKDDALARSRLRAALDPTKPYFQHLFAIAHEQLMAVRAIVPDAGGLLLARNRTHARMIRTVLRTEFGIDALIAVGSAHGREQKDSEEVLARFATIRDPWLIAVKMASEGYDCPRLCVLLYATTQYTEWSVIQAVGRIVRGEDTAFVFAPGDPRAHDLFGLIFEGFVVAKAVPKDPGDDEEDDNGPTTGGRLGEIETITAAPTTALSLIEGGQFTGEDIAALRAAATEARAHTTSTAALAMIYCRWFNIHPDDEDLAALNARADARLAVLCVQLAVRREVNDLVTAVVSRHGGRHAELNGQIKRRWTRRPEATLPQLWEIRRWLRAQLG
jgi:superfamily II DNA or RNA helicase